MQIVIYNREKGIAHNATFSFDELGGDDVGDIKNVFLYPSAPPDGLVVERGARDESQ